MYDDHHDLRILTTAPTSSTPISFIGGIPEEEWEDGVGPIAGRKDDAWGSTGTPRMQTNSKEGWGSGGGWPGPAHTPVSGGTPKSVPHRKADTGWVGREASAAVNNRDWGDGHNDRGGWGHHGGGGHGGGSAGPDRWVDQYDDEEDDEGEVWGEPSQPSFGPSTQGGWMSWGEEARKLTSKNNNNQQHRWSGAPPNGTPKGWNSQLDAGNRMQQQQEMRQLQLNQALQHQRQLDYQPHPQQQHPYQQHPQHPQHQQHQQQLGGMKNKKQKKLKTGEDQYSEVAGWGDEWGDRLGDTNHGENGWGNMEDRRQESRTLSYARQGMDTSINNHPVHNQMQDHANVRFTESKGAALAPVQQALFSDARPARSRFHWLFSSDKDERVRSLLAWIQTVSYDLASFGLHKFLQSRERGALFVNADYRPTKSPNEYAFDWLTYDRLQLTRDRVLQESAGSYDPTLQVIVFVFLPSQSGNSMAIWRRKVAVPDNLRLAYQAQIVQALAALRRKYIVHVDELPGDEPISPLSPLVEDKRSKGKKRSWWKRLFTIDWR